MLTREEYNYLIKCYEKEPHVEKQINYYFDTDGLDMNQNNVTCRIRQKDGKYAGTVKKHVSDIISYETPVEIRNGLEDNVFTDLGLKLQGALYTQRGLIFEGNGCVAVIDKNDYLGYTDYELEIEYLPQCENEADVFLRNCVEIMRSYDTSITYTDIKSRIGVGKNKSQRFFERKLFNPDTD